jgi:hypothetical protein
MTEVDAHASNIDAFSEACEKGHLSTAQWLHATFPLTPEQQCWHCPWVFRVSCAEGRLEVAQWLFATFRARLIRPRTKLITKGELARFRQAGYVEMAQWLKSVMIQAEGQERRSRRDRAKAKRQK